MGRYTSGGIGRDIIAGAAAGLAAVWVIEKMQLHTTHAAVTPDQPEGVDPAHALASRAAAQTGAAIGPEHDNAVGHTLHYVAGAGLGALYGLLRGMAPSVTTARGAVYGFVTYLVGDEVGMPAMGLSKGPLHYPIKDHARGALGHTLYGVFTDLGTRLMAPWKDEVVVLRGPSISERIDSGRQALEDGRDRLYTRGRAYAEQGRETIRRGRDTLADTADDLRARLDDADLPGRVKRGRKTARRWIDRVGDYLPDADDVAEVVERGRRYVRDAADAASSRVPDRGDLDDAVAEGRRRGQRWAKRVRDRLPDADDIADTAAEMTDRGRRRVRELAHDARDQAEAMGGPPVKRFLHWLIG